MKHNFTLFKKVFGSIILMGLFSSSTVLAQVSMDKYNTYYSQKFDGLPNNSNGTWVSGTEYFTGWRLHRTKPELTTLVVGAGSWNAGNLYSYGEANSTDRALGALGSATAGEFAYGLLLQNNTGSNIMSLDVSYVGEQWRTGNRTTGIHHITFWYAISSDKNSFNLWPSGDQGWTKVNELTFFSPIYYTAGMTLNGNAAENRRMLFYTLAVNIPEGHYIMLRWKDADEPEADHGLAIDDFSLTWRTDANAGPAIMPIELKNFKATTKPDKVELYWETASEKNSDHFIVERSTDGRMFEGIGLIKGAGTSHRVTAYNFLDQQPLSGTSYYRLKQVDDDGTYTYSRLISISRVVSEADVQVYPTMATHNLNVLLPQAQKYSRAVVVDVMGKQLLQASLTGEAEQSINISSLSSGMYVLVLQDAKGNKITKRFKKV